MRLTTSSVALATLATIGFIALSGCGTESPVNPSPSAEVSTPPTATDSHDDDHDHEAKSGPHGGDIIDLGHDHQFHAEIVEDHEARAVTIHLLNTELQAQPIEAPSIRLSLLVEGKSQQFELPAVDPVEGRTSTFRANTRDVFDALHEHHATGKLLVTVEGKAYSGTIDHEHDDDHPPHDHDHHEAHGAP